MVTAKQHICGNYRCTHTCVYTLKAAKVCCQYSFPHLLLLLLQSEETEGRPGDLSLSETPDKPAFSDFDRHLTVVGATDLSCAMVVGAVVDRSLADSHFTAGAVLQYGTVK